MSQTLTDITGVGPSTAEILLANDIDSVKKLARIDLDTLTRIPGIGDITGRNMIEAAKELISAKKANDKGKKKDKKDKKRKKGKNKKGKKNKK